MQQTQPTAQAVRPADGRRPRLVFAYSHSSGMSRRVDGFLAQMLQRRHNHRTFALRRLDVEARPELAALLGVDEIPTILVIEGRLVRRKLARPRGAREIEEALSEWLH